MSNQLVELEALEGWLIKKKRPDKTSFFGKDTKRWFKIQKIKGSAMDDLCMCYFKGPNDDAPSGWIYLKDVRELSDDGKIFTVVTTQRKIVLEAQSKAEHKLWLQGLVDYSPFVTSLVGIQSDINYRRKTPMPTPAIGIPIQGREVVSRHDDNDAKPGSFVPRERTFSRHIQDGDMSNAGGPGAASFRQSYNMENERSFYHHMNNNSDTEDSGRERETATTRHRDRDGEGSAPIVQPRKKDLTRGGGVGTMGANAGSSSSRMYAHIAKNNSSGSLNGGNSSNNEGSLSLSTSRPRSRDAKDEEPDIDTDYTSLAADKLEPVRQRLQQLEDDAADAKDSSDEEGMRRRSPPRISTSPAPAPGDTINDPTKRSFTPKGPVSHFQTASGGDAHINLPTRDMKSSVDDIISRSSSQCNSARRAPPISSYSPRTSVDQQNRGGLNDDDDDDDMPFDISAEKMRYSSNAAADSKDDRSRSNSTILDEKGNQVMKPPLGRTVSGSGSAVTVESHARRPPPPSSAPPSKYNAHLAGAIPVDTNFVNDQWDSDSDDEDGGRSTRGNNTPSNFRSDGSRSGSATSSRPITGGGIGVTGSSSNIRVMHSSTPRSNVSSRGSADAGVRQDENWLDDNFDM